MKFHSPASKIFIPVLASLLVSSAYAKVTEEEAAKLGKSLTCVGAEKAGTASGVPEYTGKWLGTPPGVNYPLHVGKHPIDPYADEKPIAMITAENMAKYADKLTDGQKGMFKIYPKTYRMPVYTGHRDFRYPDFVCDAAKKNALESEMNPDGLGVKSVKGSMPFPIPKTGLELTFNNLLPFRAFTEHTNRDNVSVLQDGTTVWSRYDNLAYAPIYTQDQAGKPMEGVMSLGMNKTLMPERDKGAVNVSQEPVDFGKQKRLGGGGLAQGKLPPPVWQARAVPG